MKRARFKPGCVIKCVLNICIYDREMYMVSYGDPNQLLLIACVEGYLAVKYKAV